MGWQEDASRDDALVAAVGDGSREALGEIYRRYGGAVWSVAKRVCPRPELAEQVCQAVFTELWSRPERFDAGGALRSRLVAEAHARAVAATGSEPGVGRDVGTDSGRAVDGHAALLPEDARRAVDQLPAAEREAVLLAYFGDPAYSGERGRRPPDDTVKGHMRGALLNLRRALAAEGVTT